MVRPEPEVVRLLVDALTSFAATAAAGDFGLAEYCAEVAFTIVEQDSHHAA